MKRIWPLLVASVCIALPQCLEPGPPRMDSTTLVLESLAGDVALHHYHELERRSESMAQSAVALCNEPSMATLDAARQAWWVAREPWKRAEVIQFGPVVEYPLRVGPKLDDWPVNAVAVEELIEGEQPLDPASFGQLGTAHRGFPVVEYLLWSHGDETLSQLTEDSRRCQALVGAATDVHASAGMLVVEWTEEWIPRLTQPETVENNVYDDTKEVLDEWVNRMGFTVENIRLSKLGKPVGDEANGRPQPDVIESRYSGRSLTDAQDALLGVRDVWFGEVVEGTLGIRDLVRDQELIDRMDDLLRVAQDALALIPETLEIAIVDDPESIAQAQGYLLQIQILVQTELADSLGADISFNDADGD